MTKLMTVHDLTEADIYRRAVESACPDCGAAEGKRCRILTRTGGANPGQPVNTKVDVRRKPCPGRASVAWRALLAEPR
jgi:hypothetical protein